MNGTTTNFVWNGNNLAYEKANGKENYYYYDITGITSAKTDGVVKNYLKNSHGDVTAIADSTGTIVNDYFYDAFGNEKTENAADTNPFRYAGEYFDAETGQIYLRNRYYDPATGRFISEDPVRDGYNWYVYCKNNPIRYIDPTGYITDEEQKMYENGEMAPMAYSYLMNLTYQWYLANDEASKAIYHQWAEDFRENDYKTTNGVFPNVDAGIEYMPTAPTDSITKEQHFFRNELNLQFSWETFKTLNERLPDNLKWKELPIEQSAFHKFGQINNRKYVSACEHFEVVYTKENYLVDENFSALNMGTYNFYGPAQVQKHADIDVEPWLKWGNTPKGWIWSDLIN